MLGLKQYFFTAKAVALKTSFLAVSGLMQMSDFISFYLFINYFNPKMTVTYFAIQMPPDLGDPLSPLGGSESG